MILKDLDKINFNSPELLAEFEAIKERGERLLESTKVDSQSLNKSFDI